jgi:hypothetical protein
LEATLRSEEKKLADQEVNHSAKPAELIATMERVAQLYVVKCSRYFGYSVQLSDQTVLHCLSENSIHENNEKTKKLPNDLQQAKDLYAKLVNMRRQNNLTSGLAFDCRCLARLQELSGQLEEAWINYQTSVLMSRHLYSESETKADLADKLDTIDDLMRFVQAHDFWNKMPGFEDKLLENKDSSAAISILIAMYSDSYNRPDDALRLFKKITAKPETPPIRFPTFELVTLIDRSADEDRKPIITSVEAWTQQKAFTRSELISIAGVLEKRGWNDAAKNLFENAFVQTQCSDLIAANAMADFYQRHNRSDEAVATYKRFVEASSQPQPETVMGLANASDSAERIIEKITPIAATNKTYKNLLVIAQAAKERTDARKNQIECLELAESLCTTGEELESQNKFAAAEQQYDSALDIRRKNLPPTDRLLAEVLVDEARVNTELSKLQEADAFFQQAISIYRNNHLRNDSDFESALQLYGSLLSRQNSQAHAAEVYAEAEKIHADGK